MFPPTRVCNPAPMVPKIERERTMMPRTTPKVFTTRYPGNSKAVVVMDGFIMTKFTVEEPPRNDNALSAASLVRLTSAKIAVPRGVPRTDLPRRRRQYRP